MKQSDGSLLILTALAVSFTFPYFNSVKIPGEGFSTIGSDTVRAEVTQIIEEGEIDMGGHTQKYQVARVNILDRGIRRHPHGD